LIFKEVLPRCSGWDRNGIVTRYIAILSKKPDKREYEISIDRAYPIFKELLEHKTWLSNENKGNIISNLEDTYYSSVKILSLFKKDQKEFIAQETISKFIGTFSNDDVENKQNINAKIDLLLDFKEIFVPPTAQNIVKKMDELLKNENAKPYREQKENLLNRIEDILDVFYEQIMDMPDPNILNAFTDTVNQGMNALGPEKKIFVFTCLKLINLLKDKSKKSNVNSLVQNFFSSSDFGSIKFVFDKIDRKWKEELIKKYRVTFDQRVSQQQPIFDFLYPLSPQDIRTQWLMNLINSMPGRGALKLKDLNYKVDDEKKIVEILLAKVKEISFQEKESFYEAINKMKCANDAELRSNLASQIKFLLKNNDQNMQKAGYDLLEKADYLSAPVRREIIREIVEWLRSLEPPNAGQKYSVKSIILNRDILGSLPSVQGDYVDFLFDKLIKRGVNINNIKLGIEMLSEIELKYEDYTPLFDDVFARAEREGNDQIKSELKNGLLKLLKLSGLNKKNRNFCTKVEKL